jgi:hypothetical protein
VTEQTRTLSVRVVDVVRVQLRVAGADVTEWWTTGGELIARVPTNQPDKERDNGND